MSDVFKQIDYAEPHIGRVYLIITRPEDIRRKILIVSILAAFAWLILGWDSTWQMLAPVEKMLFSDPFNLIPSLLNVSSQLRIDMWRYYGVGDHWTAPIIYGGAYYFLSLHLERVGVVGSLNFFATSCLSLMNLAFFETAWNQLYGRLHGQMWVCTFIWGSKQFSNLGMFLLFFIVGGLTLLILYGRGYKIKLTKRTVALFVATLAVWIFWVSYPLPFQHVTVDWWTSGALFPQTFYAVNTGTLENQVLSSNYVGNDVLHAVNIIAKSLTTYALLELMKVKKANA